MIILFFLSICIQLHPPEHGPKVCVHGDRTQHPYVLDPVVGGQYLKTCQTLQLVRHYLQ